MPAYTRAFSVVSRTSNMRCPLPLGPVFHNGIQGEGSEAEPPFLLPQVLQTLDQDLLAFRGCIQSIGTQFDSGDNRREIKRLRSVIKKKIGNSENTLKAMHGR